MATIPTDGSISAINTAIAGATAGDIITIPSGTYNSYGASNAAINLNKAVTVQGAGKGVTIFNLSSSANYPFNISAAGTFKGFTVNQNGVPIMTIKHADGWRVTDVALVDPLTGSHPYQMYIENAHGLFDHCTFTLFTEQIFMRGKTNAWTTAHTMGTADAVYFEDCIFNGASGAYLDGNSNAKFVARNCTIDNQFKFDLHGKHSNTPPRGGRHVEIYRNVWTPTSGFYAAIELRSGSGMVWDNRCLTGWFLMQDYYVVATTYTAADYPIDDQIGVGQDPKVAASAPMYHWMNTRNGSTPWYWQAASTSMAGVIENNRDVFQQASSFNGTGGVGGGTKAQMLAITPTLTNVGFWVTDEGSWDTTLPAGTSGQLYTWSGSAWVLKYTPYTYPHPLNDGVTDENAPTLSSATIPTGGTTMTLAFSEAVTRTAGTPTVSLSGGACTLTYSSGSGSASHVYTLSRTVDTGETGTLAATLSAGDWVDASDNSAATISGFSITNNSTQGASSALAAPRRLQRSASVLCGL